MKKPLRNILILLLAAGSIFILLRYVASLKENIASLENQKQNLLQDLEKEKKSVQQLKARNTGLKSYLRAAHKKIIRVKEQIGNFDLRFSILRAENKALVDERQRLAQENASLKTKLSSVDELKKAIRELKRRAKIEGNRGFLIKNSQLTTSPAKVKIEVIPAPKEQ